MLGNSIKLVNPVKLLGVQLSAYKKIRIDIGYMGYIGYKSKFYRAFNGLFHNAAKLKDELITMHLVSLYCKQCLLYGTEACCGFEFNIEAKLKPYVAVCCV